jgi:hypothetical protein
MCTLGVMVSSACAQTMAPQRLNPQSAPEQGSKRMNFDERRALRQEIRSHGQLGLNAQNASPTIPIAASSAQPSVLPSISGLLNSSAPNGATSGSIVTPSSQASPAGVQVLPIQVMSDTERQQLRMQIREQRKLTVEAKKPDSRRAIYPTPTEVDR